MDKLVNSGTGIPALLCLKLNLCSFHDRAGFSLNSYSMTKVYNRRDIGHWKRVLWWVYLKQFHLTFMSAAPVLAQGQRLGVGPAACLHGLREGCDLPQSVWSGEEWPVTSAQTYFALPQKEPRSLWFPVCCDLTLVLQSMSALGLLVTLSSKLAF